MSIFTETRDDIADRLNAAAEAINHFCYNATAPFESPYNIYLYGIGDSTPLALSPVGAIVMVYHANAVGWQVPRAWNHGHYWTRYPALAVFAKYLASKGLTDDGMYPVAAIETWCGRTDHTAADVVLVLRAAACAVRASRPDSALLAVVA